LDRGAIHDYETCAHRALKKQSKILIFRSHYSSRFGRNDCIGTRMFCNLFELNRIRHVGDV